MTMMRGGGVEPGGVGLDVGLDPCGERGRRE